MAKKPQSDEAADKKLISKMIAEKGNKQKDSKMSAPPKGGKPPFFKKGK